MPRNLTAHASKHLGKPPCVCIAFGAEPVVALPRGIYLLHGSSPRRGCNRCLSPPVRRCIARRENTRVEFGVSLASSSVGAARLTTVLVNYRTAGMPRLRLRSSLTADRGRRALKSGCIRLPAASGRPLVASDV